MQIQGKIKPSMKMSSVILLLLQTSLHTVNEGHAINPSCRCIRFTSTNGKSRGTFSSPDYPRPYSAPQCLLYTFRAEEHQIVELVFNDFDIYKEDFECLNGDYLKVFPEGGSGPGPPGINEQSVWSKVLCGSRTNTPPAVYSYGSQLVLEFHAGAKQSNATGFIGTFKFINRKTFETDGVLQTGTLCDYVFTSETGQPTRGRFYSPRYPSAYPANVRCHYRFHAGEKDRVKLVFEESFLQKGDESCLDRMDVIRVFDGGTTGTPVLAILCNELTGYEVLSNGQDLLVEFTANSEDPGQGFKASYHFQSIEDAEGLQEAVSKKPYPMESTGLGPAVSAATSIGSCDRVFSSDSHLSGRVTSPQYPAPFPPRTRCRYEFYARGRQRVRIVFEDLSLQRLSDHNLDCESMDAVDVYLYGDGRLEKMASYCGNDTPKPIMSNGPKLTIEFRGLYSSRHSRGFKLAYSFVGDFGVKTGRQLLEFPCAFVYNSSVNIKGVIMSPNYPGLYPRDTECNYFFHGRKEEKVHLHFRNFDVEGVVPCESVSASDFVQFSNEILDKKRQRYCGQLENLYFTSDNNYLRVTFRSNDRLDGTGFKADFIFIRDSDMQSRVMPTSDSSRALQLSLQFPTKILLYGVLSLQMFCEIFQ